MYIDGRKICCFLLRLEFGTSLKNRQTITYHKSSGWILRFFFFFLADNNISVVLINIHLGTGKHGTWPQSGSTSWQSSISLGHITSSHKFLHSQVVTGQPSCCVFNPCGQAFKHITFGHILGAELKSTLSIAKRLNSECEQRCSVKFLPQYKSLMHC